MLIGGLVISFHSWPNVFPIPLLSLRFCEPRAKQIQFGTFSFMNLWDFTGADGKQQELSLEESKIIEAAYKDSPAKPLKLRTLIINFKNKTAVDAASHSSFHVGRKDGAWNVKWNEKWRQLPWELNNRLSESYYRNPAAVVEATSLFRQPGTYLFNLINMTVTDVSNNNATLPLQAHREGTV